MTIIKHTLVAAFALAIAPILQAQTSGYGLPILGTQSVTLSPGETTVVVPQFLNSGAGLLTQAGVITNNSFGVTNAVTNGVIANLSFANNFASGGQFKIKYLEAHPQFCVLTLVGDPPLNSYGSPLKKNQCDFKKQPYFAYVTEGRLQGNYFTVVNNNPIQLVIHNDPDHPIRDPQDIVAIRLQPYWTLSSLFPSGMANYTFIPTTNRAEIQSQVVISPIKVLGGRPPEDAGKSYFFNARLNSWVRSNRPKVSAGNDVIAPGAYVYFKNLGTNPVSLTAPVAGEILTEPFIKYFHSSARVVVQNPFCLPRNTPYQLSEIGFTDANFTPSLSHLPQQRQDVLLQDNGHGGVAAIYYRYQNQFYQDGQGETPTNPTFPPGTVWVLKKPAGVNGVYSLTNYSNFPKFTDVPSPDIFTNFSQVYTGTNTGFNGFGGD